MAFSRKKAPTPLAFDLVDLPPGGRIIQGEVTPEELELENEERRQFVGPIRFRLHLSGTNSSRDLLVQGSVSAQVEAVCDRCDQPFLLEVTDDQVSHDIENAFGKTIDLSDDIREDILMAFPLRFLCHEDCLGLCPTCGADLNQGCCQCQQEESAPSPEPPDDRPTPWGALDALDPQ